MWQLPAFLLEQTLVYAMCHLHQNPWAPVDIANASYSLLSPFSNSEVALRFSFSFSFFFLDPVLLVTLKVPPGSYQGNFKMFFIDLWQHCPDTWQRGNMWTAWSSGVTEPLSRKTATCWLLLWEEENLLVFWFLVFGYCLTCSWEHSTHRGREACLGAWILTTGSEARVTARETNGSLPTATGPSSCPAWKHLPKEGLKTKLGSLLGGFELEL